MGAAEIIILLIIATFVFGIGGYLPGKYFTKRREISFKKASLISVALLILSILLAWILSILFGDYFSPNLAYAFKHGSAIGFFLLSLRLYFNKLPNRIK